MKNKVNEWLNSGEYISDVDELRTSIMKQSAKSNSESTTANVFERELYYIIRKRTGIILEIIKEQTVSGINHTFGELVKRKSGQGRLDAVVNNLIIEYKHHSKLKTKENFETAAQQVVDYLNAIYIEQKIQYNAILTDGIKVCYANLLASSMNIDKKGEVHPAFVDIIKQLAPDEAKLLKYFSSQEVIPAIEIQLKSEDRNGFSILEKLNVNIPAGILDIYDNYRVYIENLCRLQLIEIPPDLHYTTESLYASLESSVEYIGISRDRLDFNRKMIRVTQFGEKFTEICQ